MLNVDNYIIDFISESKWSIKWSYEYFTYKLRLILQIKTNGQKVSIILLSLILLTSDFNAKGRRY